MKDINILLFLSDYKELATESNPTGAKEEKYNIEGSNREIPGIQTNDAPIRYMLEQIRDNGDRLKRILCITSYKNITTPKDKPQYDRFKEFVEGLCQAFKIKDKCSFIWIPYDYSKNNKEITKVDYGRELPKIIYENLSESFETISDKEEVYIDYTGGLRDISFLMTSIIRFLEFKGLRCGELVYSNYFTKKLYDIHYIYDLYQLINGVNEFTNTGNARELSKIYKNIKENSPAKNLVNQLVKFSDALSICDIGSLDNLVKSLLESINDLEKSDDNDLQVAMLKTLVPIIRKKMYLEQGLDYPKMIQWCVDNNMIQQAATIYCDKMPKYYYEKNMIPDYVDFSKEDTQRGHNKYGTWFYTDLYDRAASGIELEKFRAALEELKINSSVPLEDILAQLLEKREEYNSQPIIYNAFEELGEFIKIYYAGNSKNKKEGCSNGVYHRLKYDAENSSADEDGYIRVDADIPSKFADFWNELKGKSCFWLHRFLYNNEVDYLAIATPKGHNSDKTLRKKAFAVQRMKEGKIPLSSNCTNDKTSKIMAYYLAVKIIRNRINHAGEDKRTNDEVSAIKILKSLNIGIDFNDDIDSYRNILLKGINII